MRGLGLRVKEFRVADLGCRVQEQCWKEQRWNAALKRARQKTGSASAWSATPGCQLAKSAVVSQNRLGLFDLPWGQREKISSSVLTIANLSRVSLSLGSAMLRGGHFSQVLGKKQEERNENLRCLPNIPTPSCVPSQRSTPSSCDRPLVCPFGDWISLEFPCTATSPFCNESVSSASTTLSPEIIRSALARRMVGAATAP